MSDSLLCRERLFRLFRVLVREGGTASLRALSRSFAIPQREVHEAARLGFVQIDKRKPRTGRPSFVVSRAKENVSETWAAKLPPLREHLPRQISHRVWLFAIHATGIEPCASQIGGFRVRPRYKAWMMSHAGAKSKAGARASSSRMRRKRDTIAAMQWMYARGNREVPRDEPSPSTATGIWLRLKELGSWRATDGWKPPWWEVEALASFSPP